jgi:hypothetical protein
MESGLSFKFKQSEIFTWDEISELYKVFKIIDSSNDGQITQKEIRIFVENMDINNAVSPRIGEYYDRSHNNLLDFDAFISMMEDWFVFIGATKFISDKSMRESTSMTLEVWEGFHLIVKALFYEEQFQIAANYIEEGKELYQDLENSILDLNTKGKFVQATMEEKSEALELSKQKSLTFIDAFNNLGFSKEFHILSEFSVGLNMQGIQEGLAHVLAIFDVFDQIVTNFELDMIKQHIHSVFGCIISTNMFDKFLKILEMGNSSDTGFAKMQTLQILCHLSNGVKFFSSNERDIGIIQDEGYYIVLTQKLTDIELLIRIRECLQTDWLEVVESACIAIGYFVKNDLDLGKALHEYDIINALIKIIDTSQADSINELALWCIFNIWRKYLPEAEKLLKEKSSDPIYALMFKIGDLLYSLPTTSRSCFCYMILTCGYTLPHLIQYSDELKSLCTRLIELLDTDDATITSCIFLTFTKCLASEPHFITYFSSIKVTQEIQKRLFSPSDSSQLISVIAYTHQLSQNQLVHPDSAIVVSLNYTFQSQPRFWKDVVRIFWNLIKNGGSKGVINSWKDVFMFVFEAVGRFKVESYDVFQKFYNQDMVAIDVVFYL